MSAPPMLPVIHIKSGEPYGIRLDVKPIVYPGNILVAIQRRDGTGWTARIDITTLRADIK